jgi:hypothetical protein
LLRICTGFSSDVAIIYIKGVDYAPIRFQISDDLSYWSAEIPGKVLAKAEALTGPTTPPGERVQEQLEQLQHGEKL